jgi:two-component system nitrogen regulation sensor histidine kinase NtrY
MPAPMMKWENITDLCRQAVFLQRNAHRDVDYETVIPEQTVFTNCDGRQISQAVTNLLQNAYDAIEGAGNRENRPKGRVVLTLERQNDEIGITVDDNGKGLPIENRDSLTEPYVTSRSKGTGLGLAIVKKIMEDHGGRLTLDDGPEGGARIGLILSATTKEEPASPPAPRPV